MSEPTSDGNQQPDPDQRSGADLEQGAGSEFSDPTAPVWADPTTPFQSPAAAEAPSEWVQDAPAVPPPAPAAPGAAYPYDQESAAPQGSPPVAPAISNPYAQQPSVQPEAQAYGQPQPGEPFPAYGQQTYAPGGPTAPSNTSAIVLTVLSGVSLVLCNVLAIGSLVLGIIALTKNATDPVQSRRMTKIGWIVFAAVWALALLVFIGWIVFVVMAVNSGVSTFPSEPGY